ncbi:hypothetical protein CO583_00195 [Parasaccharibacter sp. TMW2.1882]|uniref:Uncharacterized protein n=2 Tax=Acetobacteraceae TaxID=433 RepID=A0A7U7G5Q5_9PROT|nr:MULTISPECIES: hypothetical protein [Acetobacteraceae]MCL1562920.1 hypothetical protein [Parasaccharibacter sp. TMW 2.1886]MCQ0041024.1 hypothetical protein [Bombella sp.]MUG79663.1 hypothetical protein [Bombella sp. ESL0380]MUH02964.1 hypothetical protein [Bombella sp. ESL0387]QGT75294.1 hypothetical protein GN304_05790 [Bombella sp. ESL0368]
MSENRLQRLWVMDWFGHVIDQPSEGGPLIRDYLSPGAYPDTFVLSSWPLKTPARVMFRHTSSVAQNLPDAQFVAAGENLVALEDQDSGTFFSINPRNNDTHWNSPAVYDWERFILLTKEMLDGFAVLQDRSYGEVQMSGHPVPALVWPSVAENIGNFAWLGGFAFSITRNLENLAKIGATAPGKSVDVTLVSPHGDIAKLSIVRSEKEL